MHPLGRLLPAAALCASVLLPVVAPAQPFPSKPVRLVTGSQAGGGTDITARAIQQAVAPLLGGPVVIDNRPGTAGMVANDFVAKQPPDGHTLLIQPGSFVTISPQLNASPRWDTMKHLAAVVQVSTYDLVLVAHPSVPARNVKELIAVARAKPGMISFASSGVGSNFQLAGELLKLEAKVDMLHVAYRGSPPVLVDVMAGRLAVGFDNVLSSSPGIRAGQMRALAVSGAERSALLPDVGTIAEQGLPGFAVTVWQAALFPAGVDPAITARASAEMAAVLATPELRARLAAIGVAPTPSTPAALADFIAADMVRWGEVVRRAGVRLD
jgi:tripartite-type tricarboxylate transporter receptor subunit TctC